MCLCKLLCVPSKAAILLIIWTATIGMLCNFLVLMATAMTFSNTHPGVSISMFESLSYAMLAIVLMFHPLSGFIADVYCGRLRVVFVSMFLVFCCLVLSCIAELIIYVCLSHISY